MPSIVSAYYKNEDLTREFLDNIGHKVILVNAGSEPIEHPNIKKRIDLKENKGFSNSMNAGLKATKARYVCVIGNDVFPPEGWLESLVKKAEETGAWITSPLNTDTDTEYPDEVDFFPAVCWLLSRECLNKVGLFDEDFGIGTYEDNHYCKQVKSLGGKIVLDKSVKVNHRTSSTMGMFNVQQLMQENYQRFIDKWT